MAAKTQLPKDQALSKTSKRYADLYRQTTGPLVNLYTRDARDWFRKRITKDSYSFNRLKNEFTKTKSKGMPIIGRMYSFAYTDPVHKETLPYYDAFPLVFFFNSTKKDGHQYLHGLNLHHLEPKRRALLFDILLDIRNEKRYRDNIKLRLTYDVLKGLTQHQLYAPCVKTYRVDRIDTELIEIPSQDWQFVLFLPTQKFFTNDKAIGNAAAWKMANASVNGQTKFR
jgi:hypothetical protein